MNAVAGSKRKRTKFYAVRKGRKPGIYNTWEECKIHIERFAGATFGNLLLTPTDKSFSNLGDAEAFVEGTSSKAPITKYYAVKSGRTPGIYTDWPSAQAQITGWQKPRHKLFTTRAEAQRFLNEDEPTAKKAKTEDLAEVGETPRPELLTEDNFDPSVVLDPKTGVIVKKTPLQASATKLRASEPTSSSEIRVHTDGSSLGNGKAGAFAGIGVYFGPRDQRNISEPLTGPRQTNQRAELTAILRALEALPRHRNVEIITDSQYSINCVTQWCIKWRQNGWKNAAGKPVENKDLIESILQKIELRNKDGGTTHFTWTKGHATDEGNIGADMLAVNGARAAAEQARHQPHLSNEDNVA